MAGQAEGVYIYCYKNGSIEKLNFHGHLIIRLNIRIGFLILT
jgi:hypothetical protein